MCVLRVSAQGTERPEKAEEILMWTQRLTDQFVRDGVVTPEDAEIVKYGLEALTDNILAFLLTALVGFFYGSLLSGIGLWVLAFPLRKYAGGYHAKTKVRCYLISVGMLVVAFALLYQPDYHPAVHFILVTISGSYIFMKAPVDHENKVLDAIERRVYRKRTRIVLALEGVLFVMACWFGLENLMAVITMCFGIVGMSLVLMICCRVANYESIQISNRYRTLYIEGSDGKLYETSTA